MPGAGAPGGAGGILGSATTALAGSQLQLYRYLSAHRDGASYLLAVQSWTTASPYILATGQEVMPMGGFSGSVPNRPWPGSGSSWPPASSGSSCLTAPAPD